jgi:large subunit ribosomal protein L29
MPRPKLAIHDMTVEEVESRIAEMKLELFNLRFRNSMRQLDDPLTIRYLKRDVARFETALSEHKKGIHRLPGEAEASTGKSKEK